MSVGFYRGWWQAGRHREDLGWKFCLEIKKPGKWWGYQRTEQRRKQRFMKTELLGSISVLPEVPSGEQGSEMSFGPPGVGVRKWAVCTRQGADSSERICTMCLPDASRCGNMPVLNPQSTPKLPIVEILHRRDFLGISAWSLFLGILTAHVILLVI